MEIKNENIMAAYNAADESGKQMLRAMFPDMEWNTAQTDNRPITERIKTFEDACNALGEDHPFVAAYNAVEDLDEWGEDLEAYLKLRIITAALNEGWEPQFTQDEDRWFPWFVLWTEEELTGKSDEWKRERRLTTMQYHRGEYAGLAYANSINAPSSAAANFGSRLCFKSDTLAEYAGKQFIKLWMDFYLIRK